jgi:hypothetical protein
MQLIKLTSTPQRVTLTGTASVAYFQGQAGQLYLAQSAPVAGSPALSLIENVVIPVTVGDYAHIWVWGSGYVRIAG